MGTKTFLPILFDDFRLDFSERLNKKRKNRKIQRKKFLTEKTNKIKKRKNYITSMEIPMYFLDKETLKKANVDLKNAIKSIRMDILILYMKNLNFALMIEKVIVLIIFIMNI